ncbi:response regulator [bacterium]|nr:response regulator [bacterium]
MSSNFLSNRILIVDDEPNIRETISFILEMEGYDVITASDGEEAIKIVNQYLPKIILLDVMMPKKNGYEVTKEIRANSDYKDIYIVILTAKGQRRDEINAISSGANMYMSKPFDDEKIVSLIKEIF